nr:hypothetical protein [Rhodococcus sp. (in: high G+C Gram-positive bacteria)]
MRADEPVDALMRLVSILHSLRLPITELNLTTGADERLEVQVEFGCEDSSDASRIERRLARSIYIERVELVTRG